MSGGKNLLFQWCKSASICRHLRPSALLQRRGTEGHRGAEKERKKHTFICGRLRSATQRPQRSAKTTKQNLRNLWFILGANRCASVDAIWARQRLASTNALIGGYLCFYNAEDLCPRRLAPARCESPSINVHVCPYLRSLLLDECNEKVVWYNQGDFIFSGRCNHD